MIFICIDLNIMTTLEDTFHPYDYLKNTENDEFYYDYIVPIFNIHITSHTYSEISKTKSVISSNKIYDKIDIPKTIEENLKIKHYIKIGELCSICYDNINHKNNAYLTDCGHSFHKTCINKWLIETKMEGNCPICRQDIGFYEEERYNPDTKNLLDKIEDLWLNYDKLYPIYCEYNYKYIHIKGFNKYCNDCLKYRKYGKLF